jgi:CMP-N-acetylneuraminic acid synthetase
MWPVLQHALTAMESQDRYRYGGVLLLSSTRPARLPEDVSMAMQLVEQDSHAVGVVAASKPPFNPRWACIDIAKDSYMRQSFPDGNVYTKRQDGPAVYHINGALYLCVAIRSRIRKLHFTSICRTGCWKFLRAELSTSIARAIFVLLN